MKEKDKWFDPIQKMNWMFFVMIIVLVILLFFFSIAKYLWVGYTQEKVELDALNTLNITLKENTVQDVYGAPRPIVIIEAKTKNPSIVSFELKSKIYEDQFRTQGYTTLFERMFFIPPEAHSTDFVVLAVATDKSGHTIEKELEFKTKKVLIPKVEIN